MHFKMLLILLAFLTINNLFTSAEVLKCYYCEGDECNDLTDSKLDSCPRTVTTNPPETTTPEGTEPSTTTVGSPTSTTPDPNPTTTTVVSDTTTTTAVPVPTTTTAVPDITTTVGSDPTTTTVVPDSTRTTESTVPTTTTITPQTDNLESLKEMSKNALATNVLLRNYRGLSRNRRETPKYACYKINAKVDGTSKDRRGCVEYTEKACDKIKTDLGATETSECFTCENDRCNGSTALQVSLGFILMAISLKFIY